MVPQLPGENPGCGMTFAGVTGLCPERIPHSRANDLLQKPFVVYRHD